jgi:hypothetical protein
VNALSDTEFIAVAFNADRVDDVLVSAHRFVSCIVKYEFNSKGIYQSSAVSISIVSISSSEIILHFQSLAIILALGLNVTRYVVHGFQYYVY